MADFIVIWLVAVAVVAACADGLRRQAKDVDRMCVEVERREVAELPFCPNRPQCAALEQLRCEKCEEVTE